MDLHRNKQGGEELKLKTEVELKKIDSWFRANKLTINEGKTRIMNFFSNGPTISLNGKIIVECGNGEPESSFNMLGVTLDHKLNWDQHIQKVRGKVDKARYILNKLKYKVDPQTKRLIWNAFINSHLNYGIALWGHSPGMERKNLLHQLNLPLD